MQVPDASCRVSNASFPMHWCVMHHAPCRIACVSRCCSQKEREQSGPPRPAAARAASAPPHAPPPPREMRPWSRPGPRPEGRDAQRPPELWAPEGAAAVEAGDDVLSHSVSGAVPSALRGLTTVFGMGTGVSPAPLPPALLQPTIGSAGVHDEPRIRTKEKQRVEGNGVTSFVCCKVQGARCRRHAFSQHACVVRMPHSCSCSCSTADARGGTGAPIGREPAKPHGRLVRLGSDDRSPCTCRLSTSSSRTALQRACALGVLILGRVSRLDAFSGSLVRT
jgi:hypothetical protein